LIPTQYPHLKPGPGKAIRFDTLNYFETAASKQSLKAPLAVTRIIVRHFVLVPGKGHREQGQRSWLHDPVQFGQNQLGLKHMLHDFTGQHRIKSMFRKRNVTAIVVHIHLFGTMGMPGVFHIQANVFIHLKEMPVRLGTTAKIQHGPTPDSLGHAGQSPVQIPANQKERINPQTAPTRIELLRLVPCQHTRDFHDLIRWPLGKRIRNSWFVGCLQGFAEHCKNSMPVRTVAGIQTTR